MAKVPLRKKRMLNLLPRIYTAQPDHSAVGAIVNVMSNALQRIDADIERVLRDRWVNFSSGATDDSGSSALAMMGQLLDIPRLAEEATESYRSRIKHTAAIFMDGLTTPDALLRLSIVSLGAEPCAFVSRQQDATIMYGVLVGNNKVCQGCKKDGNCQQPSGRVVEAVLIDNPLRPMAYKARGITSDQVFDLFNPSMISDVTAITLQAQQTLVPYPGLRNKSTNEIVFFAGDLHPHEKLEIWPPVSAEHLATFASYEKVGHHAWAMRNPDGRAFITNPEGEVRDVSDNIYFFTGYSFDQARFALSDESEPRFTAMKFNDFQFASDDDAIITPTFDNGRFSAVKNKFDTPRVRSGTDEWVYHTYTAEDIFKLAGDEAENISNAAPTEPSSSPVDLTLSWWIRPPACFKLKIDKNLWVKQAESRGALELVAANVARARAAGVEARLVFPEPPMYETHPTSDVASMATEQQWLEQQQQNDAILQFAAEQKMSEQQPLGDSAPTWDGLFDHTVLGSSRFQ